METKHETEGTRPPDTLPDLLAAIDAWQNGGLIEYDPIGLAILDRLGRAKASGALALKETFAGVFV
jgi:hypothetical protein